MDPPPWHLKTTIFNGCGVFFFCNGSIAYFVVSCHGSIPLRSLQVWSRANSQSPFSQTARGGAHVALIAMCRPAAGLTTTRIFFVMYVLSPPVLRTAQDEKRAQRKTS
ncbi:hypothetical protein IF1G_00703 [Cordyceps javanica]|uniref:Uncharacterized protein n=1 Tax=Cordyceps javanica TaxID=43265 RepID=A0A545VGD8_9HYPO|nr:hypothetical protein IF1G_00703 [Cordyceps javanica]